MHDGGAGTDEGFGYRIAYIDPSLIQEALGGKPLPFVADPVLDGVALPADFARGVGYRRRHRRYRARPRSPSWSRTCSSPRRKTQAVRLASPGVAGAGARCARRTAGEATFDGRARAVGRPRPVDARAAIPCCLRHQPRPLPHDAAAGSRAPVAEKRQLACRSRGRRGLRRPEPHVAAFQTRLRPDAGKVGRRPSPEPSTESLVAPNSGNLSGEAPSNGSMPTQQAQAISQGELR